MRIKEIKEYKHILKGQIQHFKFKIIYSLNSYQISSSLNQLFYLSYSFINFFHKEFYCILKIIISYSIITYKSIIIYKLLIFSVANDRKFTLNLLTHY
jgi:hypothetical protein